MVHLMTLAQSLFAADTTRVEEHASTLAAELRRAETNVIPGLARWFRDRRAHERLQLFGLNLDVERLSTILRVTRSDLHLGIAVVASMVREGWTRERAIVVLQKATTRLSLAALLVRLDDPVPKIGDQAWQALAPKLCRENLRAVAACLPVVEVMRQRVRFQRYPAVRVMRELLSKTSNGLELLWQSASARDTTTRFIACRWLVDRYAGEVDVGRVLELALGDHNPRTRLWATAAIANRKITPVQAQVRLVETLERDSAPAMRLAALRLRDRQGDKAAVELAALDSNSNVRFFARKFLARKRSFVDLRQRALDVLASAQSSTGEMIGALAALSEAGSAEDERIVRAFLEDARPRVAREARRTLTFLPR